MALNINNVAIVLNAKPKISAAELANARAYLGYLRIGVLHGVSGVTGLGLNRPVLDFDVGLHAASETKKPARDILVAGC
jgi:hypothetical protein